MTTPITVWRIVRYCVGYARCVCQSQSEHREPPPPCTHHKAVWGDILDTEQEARAQFAEAVRDSGWALGSSRRDVMLYAKDVWRDEQGTRDLQGWREVEHYSEAVPGSRQAS